MCIRTAKTLRCQRLTCRGDPRSPAPLVGLLGIVLTSPHREHGQRCGYIFVKYGWPTLTCSSTSRSALPKCLLDNRYTVGQSTMPADLKLKIEWRHAYPVA